jgi:hypothetical protein
MRFNFSSKRRSSVGIGIWQCGHVLGFAILFAFDGLIYFLSVDRNILRGLDTQANFIALDFHNDNTDIIVDDNAFVLLPG